MKNQKNEVTVYDKKDTTILIDKDKPMKLVDLGFDLPEDSPTKVISLRLPTELLNRVKALSSQNDVSYTSMIKTILSRAVKH